MRLRTVLLVVGILVWVAVPLGAMWWLTTRADSASVSPEAQTYVSPKLSDQPSNEAISLALTRAAEPKIVAPSWSGLVESVKIKPGDAIQTGTLVARIGGVDRIAVASETPFTRPLTLNDKGPDAAMLNAVLAKLGYAAGGGSTVTTSTVKGIEALSVKLGTTKSSTFDPTWFIYLPAETVTAASIDLQVAAPPPSAGTTIAKGRASLDSARLTLRASAPTQTTSEPSGASDASGESQANDGEGATDNQPPSTQPAVTAAEGATLRVGSTTLQLAPDRQSVAAESLADLQTALGNSSAAVIDAQLSTPPKPGQLVVPPSVVINDQTGKTCLIVGRGDSQRSVPVTIAGGTYSQTIVEGEFTVDDEILVNPPADKRRC